jgi:hypothetical protein
MLIYGIKMVRKMPIILTDTPFVPKVDIVALDFYDQVHMNDY